MRNLLIAAVLLCFFMGVHSRQKDQYYVKQVKFPSKATLDQKVEMASRLVPTTQQLAWQRMELTAFLHFGINTFTGREWGNGNEDPALFNPSELNAEQWVRMLKDAGFNMVILTAKHHDGFCLWPTKTTKHSVASSPWRGGKGDVVKELKQACVKYGMKFGVYLSPWDRNASCYGDSPAYNRYFIEQLTELLTNYGTINEVWFDGANGEGPNGKKQIYDWDTTLKTIHRLQPNAVTAIMGDDVRWVGNERGFGRETEWSSTALTPPSYERAKETYSRLGLSQTAKDIGSRSLIEKAGEMFWYPSEVDVSIRPGWFYHSDQDDKVKSLANLTDIYFKSVGYNSVLLLNIPPDRRGLINENDVARLKEWSTYLNRTFADNKVLVGKKLWKAPKASTKVYMLKKNSQINVLMIQEDISKGQRVEDFCVEARENGAWKEIAKGTTVGYKRFLRFPTIHTDRLRITIVETRGVANVINVGAFYAEPLSDEAASLKLSNIPTADWKVLNMDSKAGKAIDANPATFWRSETLTPLVVDMGKVTDIAGFTYAPVAGEDKMGTIYKYNFYVSTDGEIWTKCECSGEFSNIMYNPIPQFVRFGKKYPARYFKLEPLTEINSKSIVTIAECGILTK